MICRMKHPPEEIRKITAILPAHLLASAQEVTGKGITETICQGLEILRRRKAYEGLKSLRGKVRFDYSWQELRAMDDE